MDRPEFLRMKIENFPDDVIGQYKLKDIVDAKGFVMIRVEKGMYGQPYAGIIARSSWKKDSRNTATNKTTKLQISENMTPTQ